MKNTSAYANAFSLDGRLPLSQAIPLGLQHVLAMLVAGLFTFVQLYPIGPIGARLPIVMGTSSGFIGIDRSIALSFLGGFAATEIMSGDVTYGIYAYGIVMGASIVGGSGIVPAAVMAILLNIALPKDKE